MTPEITLRIMAIMALISFFIGIFCGMVIGIYLTWKFYKTRVKWNQRQ